MTIPEMHVWFRQYAQQMGLQNVRAILPEQIDLLINTSITDVVNQLVRENLGVVNDRIVTDNSKIGQINAFRTLYKVAELDISRLSKTRSITDNVVLPFNPAWLGKVAPMFAITHEIEEEPYYEIDYSCNKTPAEIQAMLDDWANDQPYVDSVRLVDFQDAVYIDSEHFTTGYVSLQITYFGDFNLELKEYFPEDEEVTSIGAVIRTKTAYDLLFSFNEDSPYTGLLKGAHVIDDFFYLVDFAINYKKAENGFVVDEVTDIRYVTGPDAFTTNYFPVRLIDDTYLADTLNDFVLKPRLRSPILVIYNDNYDLYVGKFNKTVDQEYFLDNKLMPYKFRVSYIAKPATVKYSEDVAGNNVDCDLPESLHIDILKHAVDLYRTSISNNLYGAQQQDRAQQQELARNVARPTNDGYQN